jgi:hypothetical protein
MEYRSNLSIFLMVVCSALRPIESQATPDWAQEFQQHRNCLSLNQVDFILDQGIQLASHTDLIYTLSDGGAALFPHCLLIECGDQIGAVVHASLEACKKTSKNQILILGVLHSLTESLKEARQKEMKTPPWEDGCRGIFGPGLPHEDVLCKEFSVENFIFLLKRAAERNGLEMPKVVIRYPYLTYGSPETLPGIEELKQLAKDSIIVATSDLCHHGTVYTPFGQSPDLESQKFPISEQGYAFARTIIEENLRLLSEEDLLAYRRYCFATIGDSFEVGQMLRFLLGPLEGHIRDLRLVDVSPFFKDQPEPNWVAATLVELKPKKE